MLFPRATTIIPGMRFLRLNDGKPATRDGKPEVWRVAELRPDPSGIEHVLLIDEAQTNRSKTFAVVVLRDRSRYWPVVGPVDTVEALPGATARAGMPRR